LRVAAAVRVQPEKMVLQMALAMAAMVDPAMRLTSQALLPTTRVVVAAASTQVRRVCQPVIRDRVVSVAEAPPVRKLRRRRMPTGWDSTEWRTPAVAVVVQPVTAKRVLLPEVVATVDPVS
jgi:hypothetical protein